MISFPWVLQDQNQVYEILKTPLSFAFVKGRIKVANNECH